MSTPPFWPVEMPLWPQVDAVSGSVQMGTYAFEPETGLPIERTGQTATVETWQVAFPPVGKSAMEAFRSFYDNDLGRGALRFAWVHPLREVVREASIVNRPGPSFAYVPGGYWQLSATIQFVDVTPSWSSGVAIEGNKLVATFTITVTGLTDGVAIIGDHASIGYTVDPPA